MTQPHKYKVGDQVIYDGLVANVLSLTHAATTGLPMLRLESRVDPELTTTAMESQCEPYEGQEIEEDERLSRAYAESHAIMTRADGITDKYFRDGNH